MTASQTTAQTEPRATTSTWDTPAIAKLGKFFFAQKCIFHFPCNNMIFFHFVILGSKESFANSRLTGVMWTTRRTNVILEHATARLLTITLASAILATRGSFALTTSMNALNRKD
jgi:hypothetical protein